MGDQNVTVRTINQMVSELDKVMVRDKYNGCGEYHSDYYIIMDKVKRYYRERPSGEGFAPRIYPSPAVKEIQAQQIPAKRSTRRHAVKRAFLPLLQ